MFAPQLLCARQPRPSRPDAARAGPARYLYTPRAGRSTTLDESTTRSARLPGLPARPRVPALDLDPGAHAPALVVGIGLPHVVGAEAVDVAVVGVILERNDAAAQADVVIPAVLAEHRQRDARIGAQPLQARAALVHVHQHAAVLPEVPGADGVRAAVRLQRRDDARVRLAQELVELGGKGWIGHE